MKCAFIGISNWALDPAKMNRGIFVQRETPPNNELEQIAKSVLVPQYLNNLTKAELIPQSLTLYLTIYQQVKHS